MPAQKRRIFQIRQRQNRREKRRKTRIALQKEQNPLLKQLDVLGMRLFEGYKNWNNVKSKLSEKNIPELRNWLAKNVKGYGLKEAGHFLRNIGISDNKITILDRHILRNLKKLNIIAEEKIKSPRSTS